MANDQWPKQFEVRFVAAMTRMAANYRIDADRIAAMCVDFRRLGEKVGIERFEAGMEKMIAERQSPYPPTLAEFSNFVPSSLKARHFCNECQGEAFIYFERDGERWAKRCPNG